MKIKSITINRRDAHRKDGAEFKASICLEGGSYYPADINITIPEEMLDPIIGIVAQVTALAMTKSTEEFHADVKAMLAGPAIEQPAIAN